VQMYFFNNQSYSVSKQEAHSQHLILMKAGNVERMFLHDAVKPVQLLQMVLQFHFILRQLPQRLLLLRRQPLFLVMS